MPAPRLPDLLASVGGGGADALDALRSLHARARRGNQSALAAACALARVDLGDLRLRPPGFTLISAARHVVAALCGDLQAFAPRAPGLRFVDRERRRVLPGARHRHDLHERRVASLDAALPELLIGDDDLLIAAPPHEPDALAAAHRLAAQASALGRAVAAGVALLPPDAPRDPAPLSRALGGAPTIALTWPPQLTRPPGGPLQPANDALAHSQRALAALLDAHVEAAPRAEALPTRVVSPLSVLRVNHTGGMTGVVRHGRIAVGDTLALVARARPLGARRIVGLLLARRHARVNAAVAGDEVEVFTREPPAAAGRCLLIAPQHLLWTQRLEALVALPPDLVERLEADAWAEVSLEKTRALSARLGLPVAAPVTPLLRLTLTLDAPEALRAGMGCKIRVPGLGMASGRLLGPLLDPLAWQALAASLAALVDR